MPEHSRLTPEERYRRDATFHQLVDTLDHLIEWAQLTPVEVREAAVLACIHHETRNVRPIIMDRAQYERFAAALERKYERGGREDILEQRIEELHRGA